MDVAKEVEVLWGGLNSNVIDLVDNLDNCGIQKVNDIINEHINRKELMNIKELRFWLDQMGGNCMMEIGALIITITTMDLVNIWIIKLMKIGYDIVVSCWIPDNI
jgi:hypothetical protein